MVFDYLNAFGSVFCLGVNVILQIFIFRCFPRFGLLRSEVAGFAGGSLFLSYLGLYIFFSFRLSLSDYLGFFLSHMVTYSALGYCYFHFLNLGETARRIRILREFYDSKEGLSYEQLLQHYNAKMMLEVRMQRLLDSHQIEFKQGRYYIRSPLVLVFSMIVVKMKKLLFGRNYMDFI